MIQIPAVLSDFRSLKDKSIKINFETLEPTPEQLVAIAQSSGQFGYLLFKSEPFTANELKVVENLKTDYDDRKKTPGQRLRSVLWLNYEKNKEGYADFLTYYNAKMEQMIEHFKTKLD